MTEGNLKPKTANRTKVLLCAVFAFFQRKTCKHLFRGRDMQTRNADGIVKWQCYKCKKVFEAEYGLKILEQGTCDGVWGESKNCI
jgi:hypothetical protein